MNIVVEEGFAGKVVLEPRRKATKEQTKPVLKRSTQFPGVSRTAHGAGNSGMCLLRA